MARPPKKVWFSFVLMIQFTYQMSSVYYNISVSPFHNRNLIYVGHFVLGWSKTRARTIVLSVAIDFYLITYKKDI